MRARWILTEPKRQGVCILVACPALTTARTSIGGSVTLQHGPDPEHRRTFNPPRPHEIRDWFDELHEHEGYTHERARDLRERGFLV